MIQPNPVYVTTMQSKPTSIIAELNNDSQIFDNSLDTPKGERNSKFLGPILTVIAFGAVVGLSIYLINQYEKENKRKTV